jgi:hypothetical protein
LGRGPRVKRVVSNVAGMGKGLDGGVVVGVRGDSGQRVVVRRGDGFLTGQRRVLS